MKKNRKNIIDVAVVAAGKYHDIDFARLELLKLLAQYPHARVQVHSDYRIADRLDNVDCLISYTCDVVAEPSDCQALQRWLDNGGRWFALHGTNSVLEFVSMEPLRVATPNSAPAFMKMLGSQFQAHPPFGSFDIRVTAPEHPLVAGITDFSTTDEQYLCDVYPGNTVLLDTRYEDTLDEFTSTDWEQHKRQPVMYLRNHNAGAVLYLTLGHCRGHHDMRPLTSYYPTIERGSWDTPEYVELLKRGILWALRDAVS